MVVCWSTVVKYMLPYHTGYEFPIIPSTEFGKDLYSIILFDFIKLSGLADLDDGKLVFHLIGTQDVL